MKEKLTLSIEKETKERAKRHAKAVGKSVSEMVEDFLNELSQQEEWDPPEGSIVKKLAGRFPIKDDRPHKDIITEFLQEKYGLDEDPN